MQGGTADAAAGRDGVPAMKSPKLRSLEPHSIHQNSTYTEVPISALKPADSPRLSGEDDDHVRRLAETESVLSPIIVHRQTMRVVDGMHRLHAAKLKGRDTILVEFFEGGEEEAFIRSVQINTAHGLPLTLAERKAAAARIVTARPELSDRSIATYCGISAKTVAAIRNSADDSPQVNARKGGDGRVRPLDPAVGRRRAAEVITARPDASLREIAKEAGISLATAKDVRDRMQYGDDAPVAPVALRSAKERTAGERNVPTPSQTPHRPTQTPERPAQATDRLTRMPSGVPVDVSAVVSRLRRDPSLRLTESGRHLLRVLHSHASGFEELASLVHTVPPHCLDTLMVLVRGITKEWQEVEFVIKQRQQTR